MVFNFTKTKHFSTKITLKNMNIETVKTIKLLGTLKWNNNTKFLVKRAFPRMELLRKASTFTKSIQYELHIYKVYIHSVVEQSCVVWYSNLSKQNERVRMCQKSGYKLVVGGNISYEESLKLISQL